MSKWITKNSRFFKKIKKPEKDKKKDHNFTNDKKWLYISLHNYLSDLNVIIYKCLKKYHNIRFTFNFAVETEY